MPESLDDARLRRLAHLARLKLPDQELSLYQAQLSDILAHVDLLNEVNTEGIEPTAHALDLKNVFRDDQPVDGLPPDDALANAPSQAAGFFLVPKVLDAEES